MKLCEYFINSVTFYKGLIMLVDVVNNKNASLPAIDSTVVPQALKQDEVLLVDNEKTNVEKELPTVFSLSAKAKVDESYKRSSKAVQFAKSHRIPYGIWFNPIKWEITNNFNNSAEISFRLSDKDTYAFMINEGFEAPIDVITNHVIENMNTVAQNYKIIAIEDRKVNGLSVKFIRADATIQGININYMIYLHSGEKGTVQLYGYTYGKNFKELEEFLNGLSRK